MVLLGARTSFSRASIGLAVVALVASLVVVVGAPPAVAHGEIDQQLTNPDGTHPDCTSGDLPGTRLLESPIRQSFVPTRGGLASVEVCIEVLVTGSFTLSVHEGGTASAPGPQVASRQVSVSGLGDQWVHVDVDLASVTPGVPHVLQVAGNGITARWRASCSGGLLGLGSCDPAQPDRYPEGTSSSALGPNADFGFRTFPLFAADLVGQVDAPAVVCPGQDLTSRLVASVTNDSQTSVGSFAVDYHLSDDTALDPGDPLLPGSRVIVPGLAAGQTADASPATAVPASVAHGRAYVLQVVDADDDVVEASDGEDVANVFGGPTAVTGCGAAEVDGLTLTADSSTVPVGLRALPMELLPDEVLARSSGLKYGGLKYGGLKYGDINFGGLKYGGLKYGGLKYGDINFGGLKYGGLKYGGLKYGPIAQHDLTTLLEQVPDAVLDTVLLIDVPGPEWRQYFDGPIQDLTLLDAKNADLDLALHEVDLEQALELTWFAVALSTTPLAALGIDCPFLASHGTDCAAAGVDPATDTPVTIDAIGFPMDALGDLTLSLANTTPATTSPLMSARLVGDGRYVVESSPVGDLLLGGPDAGLTDAGAIVDCGSGSLCDTGTLREAAEIGALRDVAVTDLVAQVTGPARASLLLHDLVNGLRPDNDWPWLPAVIGLDHATLSQDHPESVDACTPVTYTLSGNSVGDADLVDPVLEVSLPWTARYLPGTAQLDDGTQVSAVEASTRIDEEGRQHLTVATSAFLGGAFALTLEACGGVVLGPWTADGSIHGVDTTGPWSFGVEDAAPVTTTQLGEPDGCDDAPVLAFDEVWVGHLDGEEDVDCLRVEVRPGTTRFVLQPPPGVDYDVTAYGPAVDPVDTAGLQDGGLKYGGLKYGGAQDPEQPLPDGGTPRGGDSGTIHTDSLQGAGLKYGPTESSGVEGISHLRGNAVEVIEIEGQEGEQGHRSFAIFSFAGTSPLPFVASVEHVPATTELPPCTPAPRPFTGVRGQLPDPNTVPAEPDTLFLVNRLALGEQYGAAAADAAITALRDLADGADVGVRGIVVEVDGDEAVHAADRAWRMGDAWCSVVAANTMAESVRDLVGRYREDHPSLRNVVVAGSDATIPGLRVADGATLASQSSYLGDVLAATDGNNPLVAAVAADTYVVDAALAAEPAVPWQNTGLHLPGDVGLSRVVESPADIVGAVEQFHATGGLLDPTSAFTSAYDFMMDGSVAAADALESRGIGVTRLFSETWTAADQAAHLDDGHDLLRIDGHSDHYRQLSANGSRTDDTSDVVASSVLEDLPLGGLVMSLGCNFGVNVPDALSGDGDPGRVERRADWMQRVGQRRAVAFANAGYGYGDDEVIALHERILLDLTERLHTTENVGHALAEAKHAYLAHMGAYGAHDKKAVEILSGFGLGIYRVDGADPASDPAPTAPQQDPTTGIASTSISASYAIRDSGSCTSGACLVRRTDGDGDVYYAVEGEESVPLAVSGQYLTPQSTRSFVVPGHRPGGVWPERRTTEVRVVDGAAVAFKTVSRSGHEPAPEVADRAFPVTPGRANEGIRERQTTAVPLAFTRTNGRDDTDRERTTVLLTTSYEATVYQVPRGVPLHRPEVLDVGLIGSGGGLGVLLRARDAEVPIVRCGAWLVDPSGTSHYVELTPDTESTDVTCSGYLAGVDDAIFAQVLVLNARGVVASEALKGLDPLEVVPTATGVTFSLPTPDGANGWYLGPVEVSVTGPAGTPLAVTLDGGELADFAGTVHVAGSGPHHLVVTGEGVFGSIGIPIDTHDPACADLPAGSYPAGTTLVLDWRCTDVGSGVASEDATFDGAAVQRGDEVVLAEAGSYPFTVTVRDHAGRSRTYTSTVVAEAIYEIEGFFSPIDNTAPNPISAGETVPFKFRVHRIADGAEVTTTDVLSTATWTRVACATGAVLGPTKAAQSKPGFRYADTQFVFNATTERKWRTGECHRFTVTVDDGTSLSAVVVVS